MPTMSPPARKLRCGQVFINNYGAGGGVELPFGGVKSSGHGREKGFEALLSFTVLKPIRIPSRTHQINKETCTWNVVIF